MILVLSAFAGMAQDSAQQTAKAYIRQGDYKNAVVVLNGALANNSNNLELQKDLAYTYYLSRDYVKALDVAKGFSDRKDADVQAFQIQAMIYKAVEEKKDAEKVYRTGIKKFPQSGVLLNEYGEMLWDRKDFAEAAKQWEKGIEVDPNYSGNYYNASKYYYFTKDKVWGIIYGEVFVNLESFSRRTPEIKTILFDSYTKLFSDVDIAKDQDMKNEFVKAFIETIKKQQQSVAGGITPESLSALRTRFVLDWFQKNATRFPFRLFDYQQQLLKEGMFDAYNQWIFGAAKDLTAFQNWTTLNAESYNKFATLQKNRVFKLPTGQYYH